MATFDAIILGGGTGTRYSETAPNDLASVPKQFQMLGSAPVFIHPIRRLMEMGCFRQILVTAPKPYLKLAEDLIRKYVRPEWQTSIRVIVGGATRQASSRLALEALIPQQGTMPERVLIHDACRPILPEEFLSSVKACLEDRAYGAWVPIVPVTETLKKVSNQRVVETIERGDIRRVQTPQVFEYSVIKSLHERLAADSETTFTDDASLCEHYGIPVGVFEGDVRNIKLTYHFELETLKLMLRDTEKEGPCEPALDSTFTA